MPILGWPTRRRIEGLVRTERMLNRSTEEEAVSTWDGGLAGN